MNLLIKRGVEDLKLPKFGRGAPMTGDNLENYRAVLVSPDGRVPRVISRLQERQAVHPYYDPTVDTQEPYGYIGSILFGSHDISVEQVPDSLPVINAPRYHRGDVLEVMVDPNFVVRAVRLTRQNMTEAGYYTFWEEAQFMPDEGIATRTSLQPNIDDCLDPAVLDSISYAVKLAERKPFIQ